MFLVLPGAQPHDKKHLHSFSVTEQKSGWKLANILKTKMYCSGNTFLRTVLSEKHCTRVKKKVFSFEWNPVPGAFSAVKRSSCCHYLFIFSSWLSFLFLFFLYLLLLLKDSAFGSSVSDYRGTKINITLRNKSLTVGLNTGWKERINMTADHQFITSLHTCSFLEGRNSLLQAS